MDGMKKKRKKNININFHAAMTEQKKELFRNMCPSSSFHARTQFFHRFWHTTNRCYLLIDLWLYFHPPIFTHVVFFFHRHQLHVFFSVISIECKYCEGETSFSGMTRWIAWGQNVLCNKLSRLRQERKTCLRVLRGNMKRLLTSSTV